MEPLRVAVIGRTGRGDWGHAIDELWRDIAAAEIVAVADESEEGLGKAVARLKLDAAKPGVAHRDWRRMLTEVKPDIVAICIRHVDCHAEMAIAAAEAKGHGLTVPQCLGYLRDNLHYDLGFRERAALALFHDRAAALSLAPKGIDLDRALALPGAPMSQ